jgi:hypothetical protein
VSAGSTLDAINAELQRTACSEPDRQVSAVDGACELDRKGFLRATTSRPGLPLRVLLREGKDREEQSMTLTGARHSTNVARCDSLAKTAGSLF